MASSAPEIELTELPETESESFAFRAIGGDSAVPLVEPIHPIICYNCNLLAIANVKGLFAAAGAKGFKISKLSVLYDGASSKATSIPGFSHTISDRIQTIAFTGDENFLVVGTDKQGFVFYEVEELTNPGASPKGRETLSEISAISPNPAIGSDIAVLHGDNVTLFDLKTGNSKLLCSSSACSMSWSPMGKQLVIGTRDGDIMQYAPNGEIRAVIPRPQFISSERSNIIKLVWLETNLFLAIYSGPIQPESHDYEAFLITRHKPHGNLTFSKLLDPCPPFGLTDRVGAWFVDSFVWNKEALPHLLTLAASPSSDITLMTDRATVIPLEDSARATLPFSGYSDTSPVGSGLDFTSTHAISNPCPGVEGSGPMPILWVLNNEGKIKGWNIIWTDGIQKNLADISHIKTTMEDLATKASQASSCIDGKSESSLHNLQQESSLPSQSPMQSGVANPASATKPVFGQSNFTANPAERPGPFTSSATSAFGKSSFGSPSISRGNSPFAAAAENSLSKPAFGQSIFGSASSSAGTSAFSSAISTPAPGFARPAFGQSSFGNTSNTSSLRGTPPPPPTGGSAFESPSSQSPAFGQSTFGTSKFPSAPGGSGFANRPAFGESTFGGSSAPSPAPAVSSTGAPAFGKSVFGQSNFKTNSATPSSTGDSAFRDTPAFGQNKFGGASSETSSVFGQKKPGSTFENEQNPFGKNPFSLESSKTLSSEGAKQPSSSVANPGSSLSGSMFSKAKDLTLQAEQKVSGKEASLERMKSIFGKNASTSPGHSSPTGAQTMNTTLKQGGRPANNNENSSTDESEESDQDSYVSDEEQPNTQIDEKSHNQGVGLSMDNISLGEKQRESKTSPTSSSQHGSRLSESPIIVSSEIGQEETATGHKDGSAPGSESESWESGSTFSEESSREDEQVQGKSDNEEDDEGSLSRSWQNTESEDEQPLAENLSREKKKPVTEEQNVASRPQLSHVPLPASPIIKAAENVALPSSPSPEKSSLPISPPPSPMRVQAKVGEIASLSQEVNDEHLKGNKLEPADFPPFSPMSPHLVEAENQESQRAAKIMLPAKEIDDDEGAKPAPFPSWVNEDEQNVDYGPLPPFGDEGLDNGPLPPFAVPTSKLFEGSPDRSRDGELGPKNEQASPKVQTEQEKSKASLPPFGVPASKLASPFLSTEPGSFQKKTELPETPSQEKPITAADNRKNEQISRSTDEEAAPLPPFGVPAPPPPANQFAGLSEKRQENQPRVFPPFNAQVPAQSSNLFGSVKVTQEKSPAEPSFPPFGVPTPDRPSNLTGIAGPTIRSKSSQASGFPPFGVPTPKTSDNILKGLNSEPTRPESAPPPRFAPKFSNASKPTEAEMSASGMQRDTSLQTGYKSLFGDSFAKKLDQPNPRLGTWSHSSTGVPAVEPRIVSTDAAIQTEEKDETSEPEPLRTLAELPTFVTLSEIEEPRSNEKGLAREFDLLYKSVEHYMSMLHENATNIGNYVKEQAQEPPLFNLSEKSLEDIENWQLADAATVGSLVDGARNRQKEASTVQECNKILKDIQKLDLPLSNLTGSIRRVGELIQERDLQDKSDLLNSQQLPAEAVQLQRAVRKSYNLCDERLRILEKEIVVIKANLVSQGGIEAPSLSRIRRSIKKISEMAERKRMEIRSLERKINDLQLPNDKKRQSSAQASILSPAQTNKASVNEMDVELLMIRKTCRARIMQVINNRKSGPRVTRQP